MNKILLLQSQHGNELLGDYLSVYIKKYRRDLLPHIDFLIANPRAHKLRVRYVETDMNRSYVSSPSSYEQRQAKHVLEQIRLNDYSLVLDLHTTTVKQSPCIIVKDVTVCNKEFINSSHIEHVVLMHNTIVNSSINGVIDQVISIEVYKNAMTNNLLSALCDDISRYLNGTHSQKIRYAYTVHDFIGRDDIRLQDASLFKNFRLYNHEYYPVLYGEKAYEAHTKYLGFKASKKEKIKL